MNATLQHTVARSRWFALVPLLIFALTLTTSPALAQDSANQAKIEELKTTFAAAMKAAKQGNADEAYPKLEQSLKLAQEAEQSNAASQIEDRMVRLAKKWGNESLKNKDYDAALRHFQKGAEYAPNEAYMVYGMGLAQINQDGQMEAALESLQKAISIGEETGDQKTAGLATERIRQEFVARASEALNVQSPGPAQAQEALAALDEMREYVEPNAKSMFFRATALYAQGNHAEAVSVAQQGLEMHRGSRTSEAKYHFVMAEAQMKQGDTSSACSTFQQAAYGDYKARAEHYLENECN